MKKLDYPIDLFVDDNLDTIIINGVKLYNLDMLNNKKKLIGKLVFWLDPCALDGFEHTSEWHRISDIDVENDIITFDSDTEAYINECYCHYF